MTTLAGPGDAACDHLGVTTFAGHERAALADALRTAGPQAPTLCRGWTARDLAAHLVAREHRPDSGPGLIVPGPLRAWTDRVRNGYARRPYEELVELVADGPPRFSLFMLPGVDETANLTEHLVHCEDVRRAAPGWRPRSLPADEQDALWKTVTSRGRMFFRRSPVGIRLARPDGTTADVIRRSPVVVATGEPSELVLFAFGRGEHAQVTLEGPAQAVAAVRSTRLGM